MSGWGLPCFPVFVAAHRFSALLHSGSFRNLDGRVREWTVDETALINHHTRLLGGDSSVWIKTPDHILRSHGFEKAGRAIMNLHANTLLQQLEAGPYAKWMCKGAVALLRAFRLLSLLLFANYLPLMWPLFLTRSSDTLWQLDSIH